MVRFAIALVLSVAVAVFDGMMTRESSRLGAVAAGALFLGYGIYCTQNFIRCREVHCAITAPGFLTAALLEGLRLTAHPISQGLPWLVFVGTYVLGMSVQAPYNARTGTDYFPK
jgi:hypothetical protein